MGDRLSILIVDADHTFTTVLDTALARAGHHCVVAAGPEPALAALAETSFDLMLADLSQPGSTALDLIAAARKLAPVMPVIVTTDDVEFCYERAVEAGAADFITKPFSARELGYRVKHVMRQDSLRMLTLTDELTGLFNRRGFYTHAEQQLKLARRQRRGIYMLYADVDGLKGINDRWGHAAGDQALSDVANLLKRTYRESDIVARVGGDEFVVMPIVTTRDNVPAIIARLMKNLGDFNARHDQPYTLSLSVGASYYDPANPCTIDDLVAEGDRSMYEDKRRKGR